MTIIDKNGIRCYTDENNKVVQAGIMEFTEEAKNILSKNETKRIYVESPYCNVDFQLLEKMTNLEILKIHVDSKIFDISFVNKLKKLTGLGVGKFTGTLSHKGIKAMGYKWHKETDVSQCSNLDFLAVLNCSDMELFMRQIIQLKKLSAIRFFRMASSSFPPDKECTNVKELEFLYCSRIEDLSNIGTCFPNVTKVTFENCKNIQDYSPLAKLKDLEELVIAESAPIADLSFLTEMKKLKTLRIVQNKILSTDFSPLESILKNISDDFAFYHTGVDKEILEWLKGIENEQLK